MEKQLTPNHNHHHHQHHHEEIIKVSKNEL